MAILVKNTTTNEVVKVHNVRVNNGEIVAMWQCNDPKQKFFAHYPFMVRTERTQHHEERGKDCRVFELAAGFELVTKANKPKPTNKPRPTKPSKPQNVAPVEIVASVETQQETTNDNENAMEAVKSDLLAKYGGIGADIFAAVCKVAKIQPSAVNEADVERICKRLIKPTTANNITVTINNETHEVSGKVTKEFKAIVTTVKKGYPVYMHGDAGTGKSHTAKQVAEALGLPFYESQQVIFAHEMKGYGDAAGHFVPTPFYKAFTEGGLFFLDEIDASQPEALVVLNTAIANGRFDFPVIGNVKAHENFRVIAAGNTKMTGADLEYTARSVQDASTKNRFFFVAVDYTEEIENMLSGGEIAVADFCRDLRKAKTLAQINLCVSYRQIKALSDKDMQEAWGLENLLKGGVFKELENDEIRIIYGYLSNKTNRWAKAMAELIK